MKENNLTSFQQKTDEPRTSYAGFALYSNYIVCRSESKQPHLTSLWLYYTHRITHRLPITLLLSMSAKNYVNKEQMTNK